MSHDHPFQPHCHRGTRLPPEPLQDELMPLPHFDLDEYTATRRGYNEAAKGAADNKLRDFISGAKLLEMQYAALEEVARRQASEVVDLRIQLGGYQAQTFKPAQEWHIDSMRADLQDLTDAVKALTPEPTDIDEQKEKN